MRSSRPVASVRGGRTMRARSASRRNSNERLSGDRWNTTRAESLTVQHRVAWPNGDAALRHWLPIVLTFFILAPGAAYGQETTEYYGSDALGSTRAVFDQSGGVVGRAEYLPFGEEAFGQTVLPRERFAGQERDGETGLDFLNARMLGPRHGRFTTVDVGPPVLSDPRTFNRYAYALSNPLSYVDPSGMQAAANGCRTQPSSAEGVLATITCPPGDTTPAQGGGGFGLWMAIWPGAPAGSSSSGSGAWGGGPGADAQTPTTDTQQPAKVIAATPQQAAIVQQAVTTAKNKLQKQSCASLFSAGNGASTLDAITWRVVDFGNKGTFQQGQDVKWHVVNAQIASHNPPEVQVNARGFIFRTTVIAPDGTLLSNPGPSAADQFIHEDLHISGDFGPDASNGLSSAYTARVVASCGP